jgi:hypothetical protein
MVPNMLESIKRGRGVDLVNTHSPLVPNILESGKSINCEARGPSLMRMEMCIAMSGRIMNLSKASSPGMGNPGMAVKGCIGRPLTMLHTYCSIVFSAHLKIFKVQWTINCQH